MNNDNDNEDVEEEIGEEEAAAAAQKAQEMVGGEAARRTRRRDWQPRPRPGPALEAAEEAAQIAQRRVRLKLKGRFYKAYT